MASSDARGNSRGRFASNLGGSFVFLSDLRVDSGVPSVGEKGSQSALKGSIDDDDALLRPLENEGDDEADDDDEEDDDDDEEDVDGGGDGGEEGHLSVAAIVTGTHADGARRVLRETTAPILFLPY